MVKKVILIVVGLFALLGGLLFAGVGAAALALGGRSGTIQSGYHHIGTSASAFVIDPQHIRDNTNVELRSGGVTTLRIATRNTPVNLFVGVGPSDQVSAYLNGSSYAEITDLEFSPFKLVTNQVAGTANPAAPADQSFWVAQATGSHPTLTFDLKNGDYRVVVMNADGSPGVATDVRVGIKVPALFGVGLASAIGGTLVALARPGPADLGHRREAQAGGGGSLRFGRPVSAGRALPAGDPVPVERPVRARRSDCDRRPVRARRSECARRSLCGSRGATGSARCAAAGRRVSVASVRWSRSVGAVGRPVSADLHAEHAVDASRRVSAGRAALPAADPCGARPDRRSGSAHPEHAGRRLGRRLGGRLATALRRPVVGWRHG